MRLPLRFTLSIAATIVALMGLLGIATTAGRAQTHPAPTVDQAYSAALVAQIAIATYQMDNAGLHALDEATAAGQIPAGALGRVRKARIVVAATQWPESMRPLANEFIEHALHLEEALAAENVRAAAPHAHEVHELGHELSDAAYRWLAAASGTSAPGAHSHP